MAGVRRQGRRAARTGRQEEGTLAKGKEEQDTWWVEEKGKRQRERRGKCSHDVGRKGSKDAAPAEVPMAAALSAAALPWKCLGCFRYILMSGSPPTPSPIDMVWAEVQALAPFRLLGRVLREAIPCTWQSFSKGGPRIPINWHHLRTWYIIHIEKIYFLTLSV